MEETETSNNPQNRFLNLSRDFFLPILGFGFLTLFIFIIFAYPGFLGGKLLKQLLFASEPNPGGTLHASFSGTGAVVLTATDVHGANGAAVDNVRYFLLNPSLTPTNTGVILIGVRLVRLVLSPLKLA